MAQFATFILTNVLPAALLDRELKICRYMKVNGTLSVEDHGAFPMYQDSRSAAGRCLECGDEIVYGRLDKKFCCKECKNRWHNRQARNSRIFRMKVMNSLEKNYRILSGLIRDGVTDMDVSTLSQMGFNFTNVTACRKVRKHTEMWCFDIRFILTESSVKSISRVLPVVLR